jgi:hypothetical protein
MKKILIMVIFLMAISLWAGNSIFSFDGYPIQYYGRDIYSMGMGDTGSSDVFRQNAGYANPAQSSLSNKTFFGTGMIFGYTGYQSRYDGEERSFRDNSLDFPYFSVSVPLNRHRFGFQFMSYANGVVKNQITLEDGTLERHEVDRYIYRADLIYSYRYKNLSLGLSGNYFLGHDNRIFEQSSEDNTMPTSETLKRNYKNPVASIGFVQKISKHAFGAYATLPVVLDGEAQWSSFIGSMDPTDIHYELPLTIGSGYTGMISEEIKVSADLTYEAWENTDSSLQNTFKSGIGLAYEPNPDRKRNWYYKMPLRVGYSYRTLPFTSVNGEDITENTISAGLSLILKGDVNRLDLGFQYQKRGSLDTNSLMDSSFMMLIGFTGFDILGKAPDRTAPRDIPEAEEIQQW